MSWERTDGATARPLNGASENPRQMRVAIVDMDRRVRVALAEVLLVAGLEVVGTAGEARAALRLVGRGADILVIDPRLPELTDGHALVEAIAREHPEVRIVLMGWGDVGDSRMPVGSAVFVTKSSKPEDFVSATLAACGY